MPMASKNQTAAQYIEHAHFHQMVGQQSHAITRSLGSREARVRNPMVGLVGAGSWDARPVQRLQNVDLSKISSFFCCFSPPDI